MGAGNRVCEVTNVSVGLSAVIVAVTEGLPRIVTGGDQPAGLPTGTLDPDAERKILGRGLPASPGAATGKVVFSAKDAEAMVAAGEKVVLVRIETSPEDIGGMHAAEGILTTRGGMTSHAAVVARGMGRPCVSGAGEIKVDYQAGEFTSLGATF